MGPFRVYGALKVAWGPLGCMGPFRVYGALLECMGPLTMYTLLALLPRIEIALEKLYINNENVAG